jgi:hypothetical protein
MRTIGRYVIVILILSRSVMLFATQEERPKAENPKAEAQVQKDTSEKESPETVPTEESGSRNRAGENLLGQTDTSKGEGRRNENVQINLLDTNAVRELNVRVGTTATIVQEFVPERGYWAAEYGTPPRNPIRAQLQQGSGVHGSLFWNHNNSIFSARSFFQVGPVKPARQNEFGATLGMPLWEGAFFTFRGSEDKSRGNVNGNILIPLPEERTPLAADPATRAIVQTLLDAYPNVLPNRTDQAARALNTNSLQSVDTNVTNGQLSQKLGTRDAVMFRYNFTGQTVSAFQFLKGQNPNTDNKSHGARITWNRVLSPATVLDFSAAFDRQGTLLTATSDAVGPVYMNGLTQLGPQSSSIPIDRAINRFHYNASIQHNRGSHVFSAGFGITRQQYNGYESEEVRRTLNFSNDFGRDTITNLRMGTPSSYSVGLGDIYRGFRNWELPAYAGDHWRASNKLTLSYAVRWEPWTRPVEVMNRSRLPFGSDWNNLGGNFGFAYRLGPGVVRSAFAVLHGQLYPVGYGQDRFNGPDHVFISVEAPDLVNPLRGLSAADLRGGGRTMRFDIDPNLVTPYSYQYNLSWENEIARGWKVQLGYVGSRTVKLYTVYQLNRARPVDGIPFTTATTNDRRPDKSQYRRFYTSNGSRAYFDAGRITLTTPRWQGGTISASYWFSKSIDLGTDYSVTGGGQERWRSSQTEWDYAKDQNGLSNFDQPHAFLLQGAWSTGHANGHWLGRLYRNWDLTSVFLLKSGTPFTVDAGSDGPGFGNVDGSSGDRPMVVDPSVLGRTIGNPNTSVQLLPRSAFRFIRAPMEMAGNLGRNTFRKGKIANLNASLGRTWTLPGDWNMTIRAEAINLSNTPQFAEPGINLTAPNFGQITNTLNDGRTFRFLLRLGF